MRIVSPTARFARRRSALAAGEQARRAVAQCVRELEQGPLPGPQDYEAMMPPASVFWVRRVPDRNLWIWFSYDDVRVYLVHLGDKPPVPLE